MEHTSRERYECKGKLFSCVYASSPVGKNRIFENHCHSAFEIIAILGGSVSVVTEGREYTLCQNSLIVVPPMLYHSVFASSPCQYARITLIFDRSAVPEPLSAFFGSLSAALAISGDSVRLACEGFKNALPAGDPEYYAPLIDAEAVRLLYMISRAEPELQSQEFGKENASLGRIIRYINASIEKKITLDGIASAVFLSKSTVCHLFKAKMKISVKQYVMQKKISYAAGLIRQGVPTTAAAKQIGYHNYANFYKAYKAVTGHAPARSAKNNGKE